MEELKPCPFCGGEAVKSIGMQNNRTPWPYIECLECGGSAEPDIWNTRVQQPASKEPESCACGEKDCDGNGGLSKETMELSSNCCNSTTTVQGKTTHYYTCNKCGNPCDVHAIKEPIVEIEKEVEELADLYEENSSRSHGECVGIAKTIIRLGYTKSKPNALVPLDQEEVHSQLQRLDQRMERPGNYYRAKEICAKFGQPAKKLPSLEEIKNILDNFRRIEWLMADDPDDNDSNIEIRLIKNSQAILTLMQEE